MADLRNDVARHVRLTSRRHTHRLEVLDIERGRSPGNHLSISRDDVVRTDLIPQAGDSLIDGHATGFDQAIGLTSRADAVLGEEFIDAKLVGHRWVQPF